MFIADLHSIDGSIIAIVQYRTRHSAEHGFNYIQKLSPRRK